MGRNRPSHWHPRWADLDAPEGLGRTTLRKFSLELLWLYDPDSAFDACPGPSGLPGRRESVRRLRALRNGIISIHTGCMHVSDHPLHRSGQSYGSSAALDPGGRRGAKRGHLASGHPLEGRRGNQATGGLSRAPSPYGKMAASRAWGGVRGGGGELSFRTLWSLGVTGAAALWERPVEPEHFVMMGEVRGVPGPRPETRLLKGRWRVRSWGDGGAAGYGREEEGGKRKEAEADASR